jgi:hypothetical protein
MDLVKGKFKLPNTNMVINTYSMFKRVGNIKGASVNEVNPKVFCPNFGVHFTKTTLFIFYTLVPTKL